MKIIRVKTFEDFKTQMDNFENIELANCLFEAIQRGMKNNTKKVSVCEIEVEEEEEVFKLYSAQEDWPTALKSCMNAFIQTEEYEKCSEIQKLQQEYEVKKLVTETTKPKSRRTRKK